GGRATSRALPARLLPRTVRRNRRPPDSARDEAVPAPPPPGAGRGRRASDPAEARQLGPIRARQPFAPARPARLGRRRAAVSPAPQRHLRLDRRQLRTGHSGGRYGDAVRDGPESGRNRRPSDTRRPPPHARPDLPSGDSGGGARTDRPLVPPLRRRRPARL